MPTPVDKDILEHLFANVKIGYNDDDDESPTRKKINEPLGCSKNIFVNIMNPEGGTNKYKDFANLVHDILKDSTFDSEEGHPLLLDYHESKVKDLILNIVPKVNGLTKSLLCIPVLCSVPFEADSFPRVFARLILALY
jgi:hypothetical protein